MKRSFVPKNESGIFHSALKYIRQNQFSIEGGGIKKTGPYKIIKAENYFFEIKLLIYCKIRR